MTTILLSGETGERFGPVWKLAVSSVAEAVRAIEANCPGFVQYLAECGDRGVDFRVQVDEVDTVTEDALRATRSIETIRLSPVVRGSKDAIWQVLAAVVLIVVAFYYPPAAKFLASIKIAGTTAQAVVGAIGLSMAIGGVAQMIAGTPSYSNSYSADDGGPKVDLFNGPENVARQGGPVPVLLGGPILIGSVVASAGIFLDDTSATNPFVPPDMEGPPNGYPIP